MSLTLTISGDFCITPMYLSKNLIQEKIQTLFKKADINIVNLECPVNNGGEANKIIKNGPHLQTQKEIFKFLQQLNITAVTLANNHILDYDFQGLQSTIDACRENKIAYTGVGENLKDAAKPLVLEKNDLKIAIVNFCENEWSIATEETAGANPLDITENFAQIERAKTLADFVIVIIHGGNENFSLPSPRIKKIYRFFADNGADAVISHHTHCISGFEVHNNVPIFYGLGNMIFTYKSESPEWFTGLTLKLTLHKDLPIKWELVPTTQSKEGFVLDILEGEEREEVFQKIEKYSAIIADEEKLKLEWVSFVKSRNEQYLLAFSAINLLPSKYLRGILRRLGIINLLYPRKFLLAVVNYTFCEAHLDVTKEVFKNKLLKNENSDT